MGDQTLIEQSLESQLTEEPFVNRQVVYCIDSNNGSYNGQIQIDTSSLSNSGRWASYSEGVLVIPFVVTIAAQDALSSTAGTYGAGTNAKVADIQALRKNLMVGLKNGYYNLIHSISVEYNNTNVVQLTPYINHFINYKLLTTLSESDVKKFGTMLGFFPDGWRSADYIGTTYDGSTDDAHSIAGDPRGRGSVNNRNMPTSYTTSRFQDIQKGSYNEGFHQRCINCTAHDPAILTLGTVTSGAGSVKSTKTGPTTSPVLSTTETGNIGKNFYKHQASTDNDAFYILAQIRLKDIADFFDKMPLTRGAYLRFLINTNTNTTTLLQKITVSNTAALSVALDTGTNIVNAQTAYSNTVTGGTNPIMIASAEGTDDALQYTTFHNTANSTTTAIKARFVRAEAQRAQGGNIYAQVNTQGTLAGIAAGSPDVLQYIVRSNIVKDSVDSSISHPTFSNCRLYVPLYTMTNEEVSRYLSVQPVKNMAYRDVFQYSIDVSAGTGFNSLLTNGVANPKTLVIIPYYQSSVNYICGSGKNGTGTDDLSVAGAKINATQVWQSPFASEPGTTSLYAALRDFNVQLSGVNIYSQNNLYDFEMFKNEVSRINAINGGLVDGLTSGLISYDQWNANMRYYVVDLSRRIKAEDAVPKSIQIQGYNPCSVGLTLMVFLEYEKSISLALDSGTLLS